MYLEVLLGAYHDVPPKLNMINYIELENHPQPSSFPFLSTSDWHHVICGTRPWQVRFESANFKLHNIFYAAGMNYNGGRRSWKEVQYTRRVTTQI
jgi:hypothetical protein